MQQKPKNIEERYSYYEKHFFITVGREEYHENLFERSKQELFYKSNASLLEWLLHVATSAILGDEEKRAFIISVNKAKSIIQQDKTESQVLIPTQFVSPFFSPASRSKQLIPNCHCYHHLPV